MKERRLRAIKYRFKTLDLFGLPLEKPHFMNALLYTDIYLYVAIYFSPPTTLHKKKKHPNSYLQQILNNITGLSEEHQDEPQWEWGALQPPPRRQEHGR